MPAENMLQCQYTQLKKVFISFGIDSRLFKVKEWKMVL